jgi:hypothetical protein
MLVKRWVSLASLLLSAAISIVWGSSSALNRYGTTDFRAVYYATRCLLQHHNPYNVHELERVVRDEGGERPSETIQQHQAVVPLLFFRLALRKCFGWHFSPVRSYLLRC